MQPKTLKIIFWVSTLLIFIFEGVMPALTSQTEMAKEGIRHLGYPAYFGIMLAVFKVLGSIAITVPQVPATLKEWAYAGLTFDMVAASTSIWAVEGFSFNVFFPLIVLAVLMVSYFTYRKLNTLQYSKAIA
ncbi:DoxX family protein [Ferruginibacter sp.]